MSVAYTSDVLIVGAGVGGLSLAIRLARKGWQVRILQEQVSVPPRRRPEIIQPAGLQALDELGLFAHLYKQDVTRVETFHFRRIGGRPLCRVDYRALNHPYPYALIALPQQSRRAFLDGLRDHPDVQIHWGARMTGVLRRGFRIVGVKAIENGEEREFRAPVTIGADGSASRLRAAAGITTHVKRYPNAFVGMLVTCPYSMKVDQAVHYDLGCGEILGCFPCSKSQLCLLFMVPAERAQERDGPLLKSLKDRIAAIRPELAEPVSAIVGWDQVSWQAPVRVRLGTWVIDGAAFMGDAAHACHPHVAQGSFQAMEDARVLADALQDPRAGAENFSARRLKGYEQIRRPIVERLQCVADEYAWLWETNNLFLSSMRDRIFRSIGRQPALLYKVAATEAGIDPSPLTFVERLQALGLCA
jgi:2-polyprenyl-6-methoxyphenol hydroxylase-like FAD-dependent oxidoreductase